MKGMSDKGPVPNGWSHSGSGEQWMVWQSQQDRLSLHFDNNSMCCVISWPFPASCCPCIAVMSTTSVKLMWWLVFFFFLLTWSLTHLCLFSFNTADGNSYQVSISFSPLLYPGYCITSLFLHTEKADHLSKIHFEIAWWFHSKYRCETTLSTFINFTHRTHRIKYKCTQLRIKKAAQTEAFTWVEQTLLSRHACCLDIKSVILVLRWSWFSFFPPIFLIL